LLHVHVVLDGLANIRMCLFLLPALQNVLQPIMAAEKSKKSLASPGYVDPCAPPSLSQRRLLTSFMAR
jgi:hypothetical protein